MLRLEPRREPSRVMFYLTPFLAVVLTLLAGIVLFEILRKPPLEAMRLIFIQPLTSVRTIAKVSSTRPAVTLNAPATSK